MVRRCSLDPDDRSVRMPGETSILLTPKQGIPGVFDEVTRSILVEAVEDAFERLDALEELAAEITPLGTVEEVAAARALHEALWEVAGGMEAYQAFDVVADAVEAARVARDAFAQAARAGLRHGGEVEAMDGRPRRLGRAADQSK